MTEKDADKIIMQVEKEVKELHKHRLEIEAYEMFLIEAIEYADKMKKIGKYEECAEVFRRLDIPTIWKSFKRFTRFKSINRRK